ncbi:hypothetical protein BJ508DRAFT_331750 [Ascobolus immersus RN42]|uniref:Uncharacterized protein n=1 Tax=Ascobolus immersus RN42 TaxID=1160509 RepID=A0A3N4HQ48_ASCIM|nr:hypothetical protein BJ508DRAFT_331750 [Ascobolus immersus RN42]
MPLFSKFSPEQTRYNNRHTSEKTMSSTKKASKMQNNHTTDPTEAESSNPNRRMTRSQTSASRVTSSESAATKESAKEHCTRSSGATKDVGKERKARAQKPAKVAKKKSPATRKKASSTGKLTKLATASTLEPLQSEAPATVSEVASHNRRQRSSSPVQMGFYIKSDEGKCSDTEEAPYAYNHPSPKVAEAYKLCEQLVGWDFEKGQAYENRIEIARVDDFTMEHYREFEEGLIDGKLVIRHPAHRDRYDIPGFKARYDYYRGEKILVLHKDNDRPVAAGIVEFLAESLYTSFRPVKDGYTSRRFMPFKYQTVKLALPPKFTQQLANGASTQWAYLMPDLQCFRRDSDMRSSIYHHNPVFVIEISKGQSEDELRWKLSEYVIGSGRRTKLAIGIIVSESSPGMKFLFHYVKKKENPSAESKEVYDEVSGTVLVVDGDGNAQEGSLEFPVSCFGDPLLRVDEEKYANVKGLQDKASIAFEPESILIPFSVLAKEATLLRGLFCKHQPI